MRFWGILALSLLSACSGRNIYKDAKPNPKILQRGWTYQTRTQFAAGNRGFEYSGVTTYENTLIFGSQTKGLTALYPGLLKERWSFPTKGGVVSPPLVDKKDVYFGSGDGFLYALQADTGKEIWKYEVKNNLISQPAISSGRLFVTTADDVVYALDSGTGKFLWSYKRRSDAGTTIHAVATPVVDGNNVLVGLSDGFLISLSIEEGRLVWEQKIHSSSKFSDVDASPVLQQDLIIVPSYDGSLYTLKRKSGDVVWKYDAGGARKVLCEEGIIYMPSSDGSVHALKLESAKLLWKFELDRGVPTSIVTDGERLYFGSSYQYLYGLDKASGQLIYRFNVGDGSGFSSHPLWLKSQNELYILSMAGNLYQFISPQKKK